MVRPIYKKKKKIRFPATSQQVHVTTLYLNEYLSLDRKYSLIVCVYKYACMHAELCDALVTTSCVWSVFALQQLHVIGQNVIGYELSSWSEQLS